MTDLRLERIDQSNWRRALEVRTKPDQLQFVADYEPVALVILSKCYVRPGGLPWEPFGIVAGDKMVGVFALAHTEIKCELVHFVIDRSYQSRGIGKAAMKAIVDHIRRERPRCVELTLTVHPRNTRGQRLYDSVGFQNTGEMRDGESVWRLSLTLD